MSAPVDPIAAFVAEMAASAQRHYQTPRERAAMRCALSDAAHLCDAIAASVIKNNPGRQKEGVSQQGEAMLLAVRRCADMIWAMRAEITTANSDSPVSA